MAAQVSGTNTIHLVNVGSPKILASESAKTMIKVVTESNTRSPLTATRLAMFAAILLVFAITIAFSYDPVATIDNNETNIVNTANDPNSAGEYSLASNG